MDALALLLANFEVSHWKWKGKNRLDFEDKLDCLGIIGRTM